MCMINMKYIQNISGRGRSSFTLAEVLVTLAVIGVIAALTIPGLIEKGTKKQLAAGAKTAFSLMSNATNQLIADNDGNLVGNCFVGDAQDEQIANCFAGKLNVIKNCGTGTGCFPDVTYKYLDGNNNWFNINQHSAFAKIILSNGMSVLFNDYNGDCSMDYGDGPMNYTCGYIYVDVNGFNGPNIIGRDMFYIYITKTCLYLGGGNHISVSSSGSDYSTSCNPDTASGNGCLGRILKEGAMNY